MRFKTIFFIAAMLTGMTFGSCTKKDNPVDTPVETGVILPLKTGNHWSYRTTTTDSTEETQTKVVDTETETIINSITADGTTWYGMESSVGTGSMGQKPVVYYQNRNDGAWYRSYLDSAEIFYKYPAQPNTSYTALGHTMNLISTAEKVTVPAGTYTCYHYRMVIVNGPVFTNDYYLAPNVGIVKKVVRADYSDQYGSFVQVRQTERELQYVVLR
ncbi:MAG: hypothetical protein V4642_14470 [Bacteroidota bacterium]